MKIDATKYYQKHMGRKRAKSHFVSLDTSQNLIYGQGKRSGS